MRSAVANPANQSIKLCYNEARKGPSPPNVNSGTPSIVPPLYMKSINQFCYNEAREGPSPPNVNSGTTTIVPPLYATQLLQSGTCRHTRLSKSTTCTRRKATVRGPINAHGQPKQASTSSTCCCGTTQAGMHTFQNTRQLLHVSTATQKLATAPLLMLQGHGHCSYHSTRFTAVLPPTPWTHHAMPAAPFRQRLHTLGATEA